MNLAAERQSVIPRYLEIASELRSRIAQGDWQIGDRLPSNKELASEFKVTPVTAREAVKYLEGRGVLDCRRGAGTFVAGKLPRIQSIALKPDLASVVAEIGDGELMPLQYPDDSAGPHLPAGARPASAYRVKSTSCARPVQR